MHLAAGLIHALPLNERRVLSRDEAASYVGVSPGHFAKLVKNGTMPASLPAYGRILRWDKASLDRALDRSIGAIGLSSSPASAYDEWKASNGQG